jgi:hypothetical protein
MLDMVIAVLIVIGSFLSGLWGALQSPGFSPLLNLLTLGIGGLIVRALHTPKDHERAAELSQIAGDVAALVKLQNPGKDWATLLQLVIKQISQQSGLPTTNEGAIARAAAGGLVAAGVTNTPLK